MTDRVRLAQEERKERRMGEGREFPREISRDEDVPVAVVVDRIDPAEEDARGQAENGGEEEPEPARRLVGAVRYRIPPGHQFQRPARRSSAGPMTMRTATASIEHRDRQREAEHLDRAGSSPSVNPAKTTIMMAAALVITVAVRARPSAIASDSSNPPRRASATRATRMTS